MRANCSVTINLRNIDLRTFCFLLIVKFPKDIGLEIIKGCSLGSLFSIKVIKVIEMNKTLYEYEPIYLVACIEWERPISRSGIQKADDVDDDLINLSQTNFDVLILISKSLHFL